MSLIRVSRFFSIGLVASALALSASAIGCANGDRGDRQLSVVKLSASPAINHTTGAFSGAKVNGGTVTHATVGGKSVLTLSEDFVVPKTPAPHWQIVDSAGNTFLLQRLTIKEDKFNKQITVPAYVKDVAKVQIWCAWAETLLGEASFEKPVK
jgi:hypothetical protein